MAIQYGTDENGNSNAPTLTGGSSGTRTLYDPNAGGQLSTGLNNAFEGSDQYTGILQRYNSAQTATAANTATTGNYITGMYGGDINYQKLQNNVEQAGAKEARTGFATNVAMLTNLQAQGAQRVKQLTDQANQALMANNSAGAAALSDLAVKEQDAITNARTSFLTNYFGAQSEARSEASFQTPEQQSVLTLSGQYPDAGIDPTDSLSTAEAKIKSSPTYSSNLAKVNQDIASAQAAAQASLASAAASPIEAQAALTSAGASATSAAATANLSGAQADYQRTLTGFLGSGGSAAPATDPDVQSLLNNTATPQQIDDKYPTNIYGGKAASIISGAQANGYNLQTGTNSGVAAAANAANLGAGGYSGATTAATNWLSSWLGKATGGTTTSSTPSLSTFVNPQVGQKGSSNGKNYTWNGAYWIPD